MERENATLIVPNNIHDLDHAILFLEKCRKNGQNVYLDFNGHKLYSCDVTFDSAYLEVIGLTKAEDESIRIQMLKAKTEEEKDALINKWSEMRRAHLKEKEKADVQQAQTGENPTKTDNGEPQI